MSKATSVIGAGGFEAIKTGSMLTQALSPIIRNMGVERVHEALTDDDKLAAFSGQVYSRLPPHIRMRVSLEQLIPMIISQKKRLLRNKKHKKIVQAKKA